VFSSGRFGDVSPTFLLLTQPILSLFGNMKPCLTAIVYGYMWVMDCLTFEDGTDMLYRNVGNYRPTLCDIPEEWRYQDLRFFTAVTTKVRVLEDVIPQCELSLLKKTIIIKEGLKKSKIQDIIRTSHRESGVWELYRTRAGFWQHELFSLWVKQRAARFNAITCCPLRGC
jgi:hypothetical protein